MCFFGAFISNLSAQEYKTFDLAKYYTPDIVRNQLDVAGSSAGLLNSSSTSSINISNNNAINYNLNSTFSNYVSTRKMIRTINAGLGFRGSAGSNQDFQVAINQQSGSFDNSAGIGTSYQLFNKTSQFLSFGGNINYIYYSTFSNKTNNLNKADRVNDNGFSGNINLYVGIGIGRIETVTDAQQAIYLIEAFAKNKRLSRDLSTNEIFSLSQEISRVKNKRFLDFRLHLIDEVSKVDSFFVANNLINKTDANYFTTLYDIWLYGDKFERKSGSTLELRLSPTLNANNSYTKKSQEIYIDSLYESKGNSLFSSPNLSLSYQYEKPFNQKWQQSVNASLVVEFTNFKYTSENLIVNTTINNSNNTKTARAYASYKLGFYPNTRTNIFAQISQNFGYNFYASQIYNDITLESVQKALSSTTSLNCGTNYYFSPQLRLSATLNIQNGLQIQYIPGNTYGTNGLTSNFSVGVNYSFF